MMTHELTEHQFRQMLGNEYLQRMVHMMIVTHDEGEQVLTSMTQPSLSQRLKQIRNQGPGSIEKITAYWKYDGLEGSTVYRKDSTSWLAVTYDNTPATVLSVLF